MKVSCHDVLWQACNYHLSSFHFQLNKLLSPLISVAKAEDACGSKTRDNMPDAPPCGDDEHTAILQFGREDIGIEQEDESEARVLDTHLNGDSATVGTWKSRQFSEPITGEEDETIVDGYNNYNPLEVLDEYIEVVPKRDKHHTQEHHDRKVLQGFVERFSYLGGIVCGKHTECQGNTEQNEYRNEDIPHRDREHLQSIGRLAIEIAHVEASPDGKVCRSSKDGRCSRHG